MPTLHRERGYVFRFFAADSAEPPHLHVVGHGGRAKLWLRPVRVARARRYTRRQIGEIVAIAEKRQDAFLTAWRRFFTA